MQLSLLSIPDDNLNNVNKVELINIKNFDLIPPLPGVYWITTNAPISHKFNSQRSPKLLSNGHNIIYNGISSNLNGRMREHLLRSEICGRSGISVDLFMLNGEYSHSKVALHLPPKGKKVPTINSSRIKSKDVALNLFLSKEEQEFIVGFTGNTIWFLNGIDIYSEKHKHYEWNVFFISNIGERYRDVIEKEWRVKYGTPQLCSYISGR